MLTRGLFVGGVGAALAATASAAAETSYAIAPAARSLGAGDTLTQGELFAALPRPHGRMWTRLIMGSGALYQKQIGLGSELAADGSERLYYELEVGSPGGSCNPNTLRKAYLRGNHYGSLVDTYSLVSNIGRAGNLVFRYGDVTSGATDTSHDTTLRLLDLPALFDSRRMTIVSAKRERRRQASRTVDTTHLICEYAPSHRPHERLRRIELWHAPSFPFGVVSYRATLAGQEPYELATYSFGDRYATDLPLSLDKVRAITKNDQYGNIPSG